MATRRNIPKPTDADSAAAALAPNPLPARTTAPALPASVLTKLLGFTAAMIIAPLGSYWVAVNTVFQGRNTIAGAIAAIVANIVLIAYVVVAIWEDDGDREKEKKAQ